MLPKEEEPPPPPLPPPPLPPPPPPPPPPSSQELWSRGWDEEKPWPDMARGREKKEKNNNNNTTHDAFPEIVDGKGISYWERGGRVFTKANSSLLAPKPVETLPDK